VLCINLDSIEYLYQRNKNPKKCRSSFSGDQQFVSLVVIVAQSYSALGPLSRAKPNRFLFLKTLELVSTNLQQ